MERSDVSEVQVDWIFDEGQTRGKRRSNEIRRFLLLQVCNRNRLQVSKIVPDGKIYFKTLRFKT